MKPELSDRLSSFLKHPFVVMVILGLGIRLVLMPLLTFTVDMSYWTRISNIADSGFGLYEMEGYYYTPVWGCVMAIVTAFCSVLGIDTYGVIVPELLGYQSADFAVSPIITGLAYNMMVKLPLIIVDLAVAYCLYRLVEDISGDRGKAVLASALWFLCPLVIEESSVHAMFDNMSALLILLSFMMVRKSRYFWAGAAFSTAVLTKFFPVFFIFLLVAWVLRREGFGKNGYICVGKAALGAVLAFVLVEIPAVMDGMFWESLFFLTDRIGLSTEFIKSVFTPGKTVLIIIAVVVLFAFLYWFATRFKGGLINRMAEADPVRRDGFVKKALLTVFIAAAVLVTVYAVSTVGGDTATDLFQSIGMKFVMVLTVASILIELYLAYRLMFYGDVSDSRVCKLALLSAMAIFLWPPAPQYIVVVLPFAALYCSVCNRQMIKPFVCFSVLMTLYQFVLGGVSCLFPIVYEFCGNIDMFLPILDFMTSYIGPLPTIGVLMAVFGGAAYLSMLNIPYKAVKEGAHV